MITLSEIVVIGILEAFGVLVLGLFVLLVLNHRLHKRRGSLATQLSQLKETTVFLLDKVNEYSGYTYGFFLGRAVEEAKSELNGSSESFSQDQSDADKAVLIRYLLLDAELAAESEKSDKAKQKVRKSRMQAIVHDIGATYGADEADAGNDIDEADLKHKWGYLCDAAIEMISTRTVQSEEDLIEIIRTINRTLNLEELEIPPKEKANGGTVEHVREEADRNRELITRLLNERLAAEAEVNVKVTELERLQQFLQESEMCVAQLEADYESAQDEIQKLRETSETPVEAEEMQRTIEKFTHESAEMLICIETLEQENSDLKNQLGLQ